jgi:hypothetical protein
MALFPNDDPESSDRMRSFMGPGQVDQQIRQAIQLAWMMLPHRPANRRDFPQMSPGATMLAHFQRLRDDLPRDRPSRAPADLGAVRGRARAVLLGSASRPTQVGGGHLWHRVPRHEQVNRIPHHLRPEYVGDGWDVPRFAVRHTADARVRCSLGIYG